MVRRKAQRIKILHRRDDGEDGVVVFVGWRGEAGLDYGAGDSDGVVFLGV